MRPDATERFWQNVDKNGPVPLHQPELGPCPENDYMSKTITTSLKFKPPAPHQLIGGPPPPPPEGRTQPELPTTSAAAVFDSCTGFAASVSRNPKQAEATILALLAKLYKAPIREALQRAARAAKVESEFEVGRDLDAINKLLG